MNDGTNFFPISALVYISSIIQSLAKFSAVALRFYGFSYSPYFTDKWYHWYRQKEPIRNNEVVRDVEQIEAPLVKNTLLLRFVSKESFPSK